MESICRPVPARRGRPTRGATARSWEWSAASAGRRATSSRWTPSRASRAHSRLARRHHQRRNLRGELERIADLRLANTVRLLGQQSDVPAFLERFDCFVLSSIIEGMPNALLEAMAMRLPAVTTSAGGSAEVVEDGVSGLLVPPRDAAELADAIGRVLTDGALAERLGAAAERRVRDYYGLGAMLRSLDKVYRRELARAGVRVPTPASDSPSDDESAATRDLARRSDALLLRTSGARLTLFWLAIAILVYQYVGIPSRSPPGCASSAYRGGGSRPRPSGPA
jgi:hypothetical protein